MGNNDDMVTEDAVSHAIRSVLSDPNIDLLYQLYYLQCRSVIRPMGPPDEDLLKAFKDWRNQCIPFAYTLVAKHLRDGRPVNPIWFEQQLLGCLDDLQKRFPVGDLVELTSSLTPRIHARARRTGRIEISLISREMLLHMNCALLSLIDEDLEAIEPEISTLDHHEATGQVIQAMLFGRDTCTTRMARAFFPYWVMAQKTIYASYMPFVGATSRSMFEFALRITATQLRFILAHEYAHLYLRHFSQSSATVDEKVRIEIEADKFAYRYIISDRDGQDGETRALAWIATRWLFRYQMGDALVGQIIRGKSLDIEVLPFNTRRASFYEFYDGKMDFYASLIAERGHQILINLTYCLRERGQEIIPDLVSRFSSRKYGLQDYHRRATQEDAENDTWSEDQKWWTNL